MKKNRGFTLIELLAVIAILAIILIIAVPKVISTVENTKIGAFKTNAQMLIRAIDLKIAEKPDFDYTTLNPGDLKTDLGIDGSNYESLTVTKVDGKTHVDIVGQGSWKGLQAEGTQETLVVTKGTPDVPYIDPSGASNPDIASNMIPIYYDAIDSKWKKAGVNNPEGTHKWYDYTNKMWANAVTVTNATRSAYQSAALGTPILETDILTYMVWIPKYKYRIPAGAVGVARTIDIVFEGSTATKSTGDAITTYRTHPAFTFGTTKLNGIWMGKYELTGTIGAITTKPGITSLRSQSISSFFTAMRNMENASNPYGYVANEVDTHMIKNNEWGAAAYLSHSIYGKNAEVTINANSSFITGNPGPEASTTGNIYGIYDMSGCAFEYVMGNYNTSPASSGISFPIGSEYYNLYTTTNASTACNDGICYGEALSETQGWYNDPADFVYTSHPWFMRGGDYDSGAYAGVFYCSISDGGGSKYVSSRACQTKS